MDTNGDCEGDTANCQDDKDEDENEEEEDEFHEMIVEDGYNEEYDIDDQEVKPTTIGDMSLAYFTGTCFEIQYIL